jgi:hypothetical protein
MYTAFNKSIRRVWKLPNISHTKYVLLISKRISLEKLFIVKLLKMLHAMYESENEVIAFIASTL